MKTRSSNLKKPQEQLVELHIDQADWFRDVFGYANDVVDGSKLSCKTEIAACVRFLNDYKRVGDADYSYDFNFIKAWHVISFIELLPHVKGHLAGLKGKNRLIQLEPWQKFIIANIFGFVRKDNGLRRFTTAYIEVPRKNGKSILAAGIGLYMLTADGEAGAEVLCGANTLSQANKVFEPAKQMVDRTPSLRKAYKIDSKARTLKTPDGSVFEPMIGKPGDGGNPSVAIIDEYHEADSDELYATMETGMGSRLQPLMLVITTAGNNLFTPCYDMHKDAIKVLDGVLPWENMFALIYGIDPEDEWSDEGMLEKANPNYGVSVGPDMVNAARKKAMDKTNKQNDFKTKHLNVWCYAKAAYYNSLNWNKCADLKMSLDDFHGEECWIGLDLAKKRDLSAKVIIFKNNIAGIQHYYVFTRFYLPEDEVFHQENDTLRTLYSQWYNEGWLQTCEGNAMDLSMISDDVIDDSHRFFVNEVPHDPFGAIAIVHEITNAGLTPVEMKQHGSIYTEPVDELEVLIDSVTSESGNAVQRLHHDGNPIMAWCIANTIVNEYKGGGKMPDKEDFESKIDGTSALLMALGRAMLVSAAEENVGCEMW